MHGAMCQYLLTSAHYNVTLVLWSEINSFIHSFIIQIRLIFQHCCEITLFTADSTVQHADPVRMIYEQEWGKMLNQSGAIKRIWKFHLLAFQKLSTTRLR